MIGYPPALLDTHGQVWTWNATLNGYTTEGHMVHGYDAIGRDFGIADEYVSAEDASNYLQDEEGWTPESTTRLIALVGDKPRSTDEWYELACRHGADC